MQVTANVGPVTQSIFKVSPMSAPGFQFDFIVRPALGSNASTGVQGVESSFDTRLHLCFSWIAVFQIDLHRLKFIQEYLVGGSGKESRQGHLRSMLCKRSLLLFGNEV